MPLDQERTRAAFDRLSRQLAKLASRPAPENVHKFRTYGRRVEACLQELVAQPNRNQRKLVRLLSRLRKKAGRVRDLDVQIAALRNLRIPQEPGHKSQLLRTLVEERAKREKKLARTFDGETIQELRRRLKRASSHIEIEKGLEPLTLALRELARLGHDYSAMTEKTLHQYRVVGKRARYLAELASKDPEAERLVGQLKRMQDVIGDWHDWLKLTQRAEGLFEEAPESTLVVALRNITHAKFRQALEVLREVRADASGKRPSSASTGRRPSSRQGERAIGTVA